jgi:methylmalonyl-CoA mutase cobalamin-binding subunit
VARRLLDQGIRPGKIFSGSLSLDAIQATTSGADSPPFRGQYLPIFDLLRAYRLAELYSHFQYRLLNLGLRRFVTEFLAPLSTALGLAWAHGQLSVRSEHLFSQLAMSFLHSQPATVQLAGTRRPKALLATLTGERHVLGILMVEAVLASLEVDCIQLGSEVPQLEVAAAATETAADIVALSFSSYSPRKSVVHIVRALRAALPPGTVLWVGGDGAPGAAALGSGVVAFDTLEAIEPALGCWRSRMAAHP